MIANDFTLELCNVFHSGQVEPGSCMQKMLGSIKTGVILKDVSLTVQSGEVLAVLGSKGSGKKALLDVIARRVQGPTRGQILLNNQPMSLRLFQRRCGYVTHKCDLIPGLTVEQTLYYTPTNISGYLKSSKVKQVMADLALSQVANKSIENLTKSEYRRLTIGVQLIKDPIILLLDEPTWDLDPLNTYLIISILSNAAKKYGSAVILTMEKPRSDVFPFLERVVYLCLGDVVYTGSTRQMLEYFTAIGFPCPQLENPLMYYLCLSTVDRRSRERFVESNNQISALVDKFKIESGNHRKCSISGHLDHGTLGRPGKMPFLLDSPSSFYTGWLLYVRLLTATFNFRWAGIKQLFLRLFLLPLFFGMLWLCYNEMKNFQHTFTTKSGLILNSLAGAYFLAIFNTSVIFPKYRTRYYQEAQEGTYGGSAFLLTYNLVSLPFSFISSVFAAGIIYTLIGSFNDILQFIYFTLILWSCYVFAEQQTIAILMLVDDYLKAAITSIYITSVCITLSSGILRSIKGLQDWLFYLTYATQSRYASMYLNREIFLSATMLQTLPFDAKVNCSNANFIETSSTTSPNYQCLFKNGQTYLTERYTRDNVDLFNGILDSDMNLIITVAFMLGSVVFNHVIYLIPLPAFIKNKFRE